MFLDGTYHVLLIYGIAGCIMCIPPLFPQWKSWVLYFNDQEFKYEKFWKNLLFFSGCGIIIVAITLIAFYNPHILGLNFVTQVAEITYFNYFAFFTFLLLPIGLAFLGLSSHMKETSNVRLGYFFIILLSFSALGLAGSFLHDILWCGTRTSFYTVQWDSGYDLEGWRTLVMVTSRDYRVFGIYMIVMVAILLTYVAILFNKYYTFSEEKFDRDIKKEIFLLALSSFIVLGVSLYIIDYQKLFEFFSTFIALFVGIPITAVLFYKLGKKLAM